MPPGVALFDYDNDGDLDVFLVQSQGGGKLYRNDLEKGSLHFTDVTDTSGIKSAGYGMGVSARTSTITAVSISISRTSGATSCGATTVHPDEGPQSSRRSIRLCARPGRCGAFRRRARSTATGPAPAPREPGRLADPNQLVVSLQ